MFDSRQVLPVKNNRDAGRGFRLYFQREFYVIVGSRNTLARCQLHPLFVRVLKRDCYAVGEALVASYMNGEVCLLSAPDAYDASR